MEVLSVGCGGWTQPARASEQIRIHCIGCALPAGKADKQVGIGATLSVRVGGTIFATNALRQMEKTLKASACFVVVLCGLGWIGVEAMCSQSPAFVVDGRNLCRTERPTLKLELKL